MAEKEKSQLDWGLSEAERTRVWSALGSMPYLPLIPRGYVAPRTFGDLIDILERLAPTVQHYADQSRETEEAHRRLLADVQAMRRVMGTE